MNAARCREVRRTYANELNFPSEKSRDTMGGPSKAQVVRTIIVLPYLIAPNVRSSHKSIINIHFNMTIIVLLIAWGVGSQDRMFFIEKSRVYGIVKCIQRTISFVHSSNLETHTVFVLEEFPIKMPDNLLEVVGGVGRRPLGIDGEGTGLELVGRVGELELRLAVEVGAVVEVEGPALQLLRYLFGEVPGVVPLHRAGVEVYDGRDDRDTTITLDRDRHFCILKHDARIKDGGGRAVQRAVGVTVCIYLPIREVAGGLEVEGLGAIRVACGAHVDGIGSRVAEGEVVDVEHIEEEGERDSVRRESEPELEGVDGPPQAGRGGLCIRHPPPNYSPFGPFYPLHALI